MRLFNPETDSLSSFVRLQGGISTKDEYLKGECGDYFSITEGYNLLNNKTGKTLDTLLLSAMEAGFLFFDATVTDFLDLLRQDVYSKKIGKGGSAWSFAKQDWRADSPDFDAMFDNDLEDAIFELTELWTPDLMPVEIFNLYYGNLTY